MSVRLKLAQSPKELNDVFWLRHQVYTREEGYFAQVGEGSEFLVDRFDAHPYSANIIAYDNGEPVGTLRVNVDTGGGLPPDEHFDFSAHRAKITADWDQTGAGQPRVCSAGMLAIRGAWRGRRDVIRALFTMAATIANGWGVTHVIATINVKSHTMYKRIGFDLLAEPVWVDDIGEYIVPMAVPFATYYKWAIGDLMNDKVFLQQFMQTTERVTLHKGEILFKEGEQSTEAYIIDSGNLAITRGERAGSNGELALSVLTRGDMVGELALIDREPRSATATALTNVELIALSRELFMERLQARPELLEGVLQLFAARLRRMDELATVLAFGDPRQRLDYALADIQGNALPSPQNPEQLVAKMGLNELAKSAGVGLKEAEQYLRDVSATGRLEVKGNKIVFSVDAPSAQASWTASSARRS